MLILRMLKSLRIERKFNNGGKAVKIKPSLVVEKLKAKRIIASTSPYRISYARIAPSLLNTPEEIDTTLGHNSHISLTNKGY